MTDEEVQALVEQASAMLEACGYPHVIIVRGPREYIRSMATWDETASMAANILAASSRRAGEARAQEILEAQTAVLNRCLKTIEELTNRTITLENAFFG